MSCWGIEDGTTYDAGVVWRRDSRVLRSKDSNDTTQTEVDGSSHESRADGQAANLHEEAVLIPGVNPSHDSAGVSDDLADETECEGNGESRATTSDGVDDQEADEREAEEYDEGDVGRKAHWVVVVGADIVAEGGVWIVEAPFLGVLFDPGHVSEICVSSHLGVCR